MFRLLTPLIALSAIVSAAPALAQARVEMELVQEGDFPALEAQNWFRVLTSLKVDGLTIRQGRAGDKTGITTTSGRATTYRVTGILTGRNELIVPGGRFSQRDTRGLAAWLESLRTEGPPGQRRAPAPFGLEPEVLLQFNDDLSRKVEFSTAGSERVEAVDRIARRLAIPGVDAARIAATLREAGPVAEELQGFSSGTALACLLRPAGLGLAPTGPTRNQPRQPLGYELRSLKQEVWPLGWPAEERRRELLPNLFDLINVEIQKGTPLSRALPAIEGNIGAPLLLDHNALAAQGIEPEKIGVTIPPRKLAISTVLQHVLTQARLKAELRADENDRPFYWITTFR